MKKAQFIIFYCPSTIVLLLIVGVLERPVWEGVREAARVLRVSEGGHHHGGHGRLHGGLHGDVWSG